MRITLNNILNKFYKLKNKWFIIALLFILTISNATAQRGVRIGYIDTEYILQNVSEYQAAQTQLENKALKWKAEIDQRKAELETKKQQLNNERVLLTIDLIDEREKELEIIENELLEYQQKRFGPTGDLMIQKKQLTQPIQDQIFTAVQEIATTKKYDFIFDKSADVVMLYSANQYNISEQVLRTINRTSKREQVKTKKDRKDLSDEENIVEVDNDRDERQKLIDERNSKREEALAKRKADLDAKREARRLEIEAKKQKSREKRENIRNAKLNEKSNSDKKNSQDVSESNEADSKENIKKSEEDDIVEEAQPNEESPKLSEREVRKKALEEKKSRILAERKAKIEALKRKRDSIRNNKK
tara:strand:- start:2610 stop:3686 length:1077 start_codon:yes stop_codon:yes gene_type:complete